MDLFDSYSVYSQNSQSQDNLNLFETQSESGSSQHYSFLNHFANKTTNVIKSENGPKLDSIVEEDAVLPSNLNESISEKASKTKNQQENLNKRIEHFSQEVDYLIEESVKNESVKKNKIFQEQKPVMENVQYQIKPSPNLSTTKAGLAQNKNTGMRINANINNIQKPISMLNPQNHKIQILNNFGSTNQNQNKNKKLFFGQNENQNEKSELQMNISHQNFNHNNQSPLRLKPNPNTMHQNGNHQSNNYSLNSQILVDFSSRADAIIDKFLDVSNNYKTKFIHMIENYQEKFLHDAGMIKQILIQDTKNIIADEERSREIDSRIESLFKEIFSLLGDLPN